MGTPILRVSGAVLLAMLAGGCLGIGSAQHPTMTPPQAVAQARSDGFVGPVANRASASWLCNRYGVNLGPVQPAGRYRRYVRPRYSIEFGDRRIPLKHGAAQALFEVVVMPNARVAARCLRAGMYSEEHQLIQSGQPKSGRNPKTRPYTVIDRTIFETYKHPLGAPGTEAGTTGNYDVWLAQGRVIALGEAYNGPDAAIVNADLAKIAAQIAG